MIILNDEIHDNMKLVKSFEDSALLINGATKTTKNETKDQSGGFLILLLSRLDENVGEINVSRQRLTSGKSWQRNNELKRPKK